MYISALHAIVDLCIFGRPISLVTVVVARTKFGMFDINLFLLAIVVVGLFLAGSVGCATATDIHAESPLHNGLYLVTWWGDDAKKAPPTKQNERLLEYEYQFLDPSSDRPHEYVVLNTQQRVPLELSEEPESIPHDDGRILLQLALTREAGDALEDLTGRNVGRNVAIVIGGRVITRHTIREVIKGGRVQISRCGDDACRYILAKLKE